MSTWCLLVFIDKIMGCNSNEVETTSFIQNDKSEEKGIEEDINIITEANEYLKEKFEDKTLIDSFKLIKEEWFSSSLDIKHDLKLFVFYKSLFLFFTR